MGIGKGKVVKEHLEEYKKELSSFFRPTFITNYMHNSYNVTKAVMAIGYFPFIS